MKTILLCVTGSIAAYKSAEIIKGLRNEGYNVQVVMSENSKQFITKLTLETLSGNKVYETTFDEELGVSHIDVVKKADLVLIAPATANSIGKLANGICDDMLTTMCMVASSKKKLIAPAMNVNMYNNPINQRNINILIEANYELIEPRESMLACGDFGKGALAEVSTIINKVKVELEK